MPKSNPYRRPSLKQLTFGFLMLLAKDFARAEAPTQTITPIIADNLTQANFTHCQHLLNDINPILTPSGLWSLAHFKDETTFGNSLSFLTDHPEIKDICDQHGENYLFHLATHGNNEDFKSALATSTQENIRIKNLADESLMDILIQKNDHEKIKLLLSTLPENEFFIKSFHYLSDFAFGINEHQDDKPAKKLTIAAICVGYQPKHPMSLAAKDHLIKIIETPEIQDRLLKSMQLIDMNTLYTAIELAITTIELSTTAIKLSTITLVYLFTIMFIIYLRNDDHPGNNPNALFNQLNTNTNAPTATIRIEPEQP